MGSAKLSTLGHIIRFFFIAWNILILLIGIGAIGVGSWLIATNDNYEFVTGTEYATGASLLIAAGIVDVLVCVLGIVGAIMLWPILLGLYAVIIAVFILVEIAAGIIGFVYRDNITNEVGDRAVDAIRNDYSTSDSGSANEFIDFIQDRFDCCGWNNYTDWTTNSDYFNATSTLPESCDCPMRSFNNDTDCTYVETFNQTEQLVYSRGCRDRVSDELRAYLLAEGAVGVVFGFLQILALVVAIALCVCVRRAKSEYTTV